MIKRWVWMVPLAFGCVAAWAVQCRMPNGKVVTFNSMTACPADAQQLGTAGDVVRAPKVAVPPALPKRTTKGIPISADTWPEEWPFAVRSGWLDCVLKPGATKLGFVVFRGADGLVYALNGMARDAAVARGWHDARAIWLPNPEIPGTRVPLGSMVVRGLELCGG